MVERDAYLRIADELRAQILDGTLQPGARLPSNAQLQREYGVSEITARKSISTLVGEGLVRTRRGGGTTVRTLPTVRRIAGDRYRVDAAATPERPETSFTRDHGIGWSDYRLDREFAEVTRPQVAELFGVPPDEVLLERRFTFYAGDAASQLSRSWLLLSMVADTPVADPANEPWPGGNLAQFRSLGITVTRVEESISSRMPYPAETEFLDIPPGVPVFVVTRRMLAGERVVEVAEITIPADRAVLDYSIDL
ncbi:GntR family transcriptional regulator [Allonocardiopsis opalescens]|uniref:GntR family transcriptional regulator n=1 Tax=Allonocardiopsis opalescens TaxID=1144618 RepID=A0A2T0Q5S5_9ACTN|nr:GntR family transcriptional regulator [Allonocardiopsis opalescens]PRX99120.1 GntR family transcriptional regulator [Allonocardiopsis opalescens]